MSALDSSPRGFSRSPNGCNAKPIWLALRPAERSEIEQVAQELSHSVAGSARLLTLLGIEQYRAKGLSELHRVNDEDLRRHSSHGKTK